MRPRISSFYFLGGMVLVSHEGFRAVAPWSAKLSLEGILDFDGKIDGGAIGFHPRLGTGES